MWIPQVSTFTWIDPIKTLQRAAVCQSLTPPLSFTDTSSAGWDGTPNTQRFESWTKETSSVAKIYNIRLHGWLSNMSPVKATACVRGLTSGKSSKNQSYSKNRHLSGRRSKAITVCCLQSDTHKCIHVCALCTFSAICCSQLGSVIVTDWKSIVVHCAAWAAIF